MARCLVCNSSYDPATRHGPEDCRVARVDESIAAQLQRSIERNSRMKQRLLKVGVLTLHWHEAISAVEAILKDEEPTWP